MVFRPSRLYILSAPNNNINTIKYYNHKQQIINMDTYQSNEPKTRQEKKNSRKTNSTHGKYNSKHIRKYLYLLEKKTPGFKDTCG